MHLLKPVYLCGPINGRSDADCNDWRTKAKAMLDATLDPMARDYRGREAEPGVEVEIVEGDKADILECRAMVVYFDKPSVGTSMEVMFADTHGIPVHVVDVSDKPLSPWLVYHATAIHQTLDAACAAINA